LHDGNFSFMSSKEDGSDLRFIADDNKTILPHHIEKWDGLLNEAYVWVQVPDIKPGAATTVWLYAGNVTDAVNSDNAKGTFDSDTTAVYHFGDAASVGKDSAANGIALEGTSPPGAGVIGNGHRLLGQAAITIPDGPAMAWSAGGALTFSAWIKSGAAQPNGVIFSRREGGNAFVVGLNKGVPFVEINKQLSSASPEITPSLWHHLAVTVSGGNASLYIDGKSVSTLAAGLPAMQGPSLIGNDSADGTAGFVGDVDEVQLAKAARPEGFIKFAAISQGTSSEAGKLVVLGADEFSGHTEQGELMKHLSLITDISKSLTFDGWVVIFLCAVLAVVGWVIAIGKFFYLNKIGKATGAFLERWETMSSDLTALDAGDAETIKSMGGAATGKKAQKLMHQSPLYHIYHLGCNEIQQRMKTFREISFAKEKYSVGLSGRSIQAIKATLHGGLVREVQKLNSKLVFLTIGIAGGPYLGLLGTVIGVMITFAVIAKSGQVEVNSIAPGIAGALLATVAGLAVAIPALFAYSYLSTRIKDAVNDMETFIDEFIAKMAEHYKE
ncbi:MAG: MotA/TolQ/ExbB proton channel family protein, partial [Prosthecobacter sp.]|nr:MotA/TolQ/ExbB proton channel family protein [Prosthecobacter sp.]